MILSGQVPTSMIGEDAFQETDMIGISCPVVKHSFLCKKASDIPDAIKKAYYIAASGRPGPVVVDLPKDVQNPKEKFPYQYPESVSLRSYNPTKAGHKGQIKRAAKLLTEASRPVMYVGGGAINANADHLVTKLAELLNLPVTTTLMGLGPSAAPTRNSSACSACTAPSKRTRACTTRISSSPWVPASMTASPTT